ncbi:hypothetical protein [Mycobacterium intracellulare]|uniref:Phosphoadenosine phosphosulfate reductase family protein n=1 Tax=Mycobacterium intracellulare subsp. chimaera TaxID=222805 RepID=A0ABT7P9Y6_MYCIT|nr:hypothetical protein [Mycobacterium intracellulare]MDM3929808.1 hypothetical protein [Mycobacterium intracellulare subsp. chimaera]
MPITATQYSPKRLAGLDSHAAAPSVVLSFGLGLDSTSLLIRWLTDTSSRDFALEDLVLVTAMTGHESAATIDAMNRLVLPRLRQHAIRYIQTARSQRRTSRAGDGIVILDDSRTPQELHAGGQYTLGDEMLSAATIPQRGGSRICSVHSKGDALDPVIARITKGRPYRHALGFEANEAARAAKDQLHDTELRRGWYPLIDWRWTRSHCRRYLLDVLGESVPKSCCGFCPFAMSTAAGRAQVVERYRREPQLGADAMFLEHLARSINPAQTLIEGSSVADLVTESGLSEVRDLFEAELHNRAWSIYEVRRVTRPGKDGRRGIVARSLRIVATGSRAAMTDQLASQPGRSVRGQDGIVRHVLRDRRRDGIDHLFVAAPAGAQAKQRAGFEQWWQEATADSLF